MISRLLKRFNYQHLPRRDKGVAIQFLLKISGYSRQQLERLIVRYNRDGTLVPRQKTTSSFERKYTSADINLLVEIDKQHDTPNGLMVKKLCERAYKKFNDSNYERLSEISVAHIYNLRKSSSYQNNRRNFEKTKSNKGVKIAERRKPVNIF